MINFLISILSGLVFQIFTRKVCELEGFNGDPAKSNEQILEAIQMTWIEEFK